jgi:hypothetical protein
MLDLFVFFLLFTPVIVIGVPYVLYHWAHDALKASNKSQGGQS